MEERVEGLIKQFDRNDIENNNALVKEYQKVLMKYANMEVHVVTDHSALYYLQHSDMLLFEPMIALRSGGCVVEPVTFTLLLLAKQFHIPTIALVRPA